MAQQRRDFGVRVALGASVARITRLVMARGVALVATGLVIGGAAAYWAAPQLQPMLFQHSSRDPWVFGAVAVALLVVACFATAGPAVRAARVDPNTVLRDE